MTRNEKIIVLVLGLAVLCEFGALAVLAVNRLTALSSSTARQVLTPTVQAAAVGISNIPTPTTTPALTTAPDTATPTPTATLVINSNPNAPILGLRSGRGGPSHDQLETLLARIDPTSFLQGSLVTSPDARHAAFVIKVDGDHRELVVDGKAEKEYDRVDVGTIVFSPDGKRHAYSVEIGVQRFMIVDGQSSGPYKGTFIGGGVFSPDSRHFAVMVQGEDGKFRVLRDGKPGPAYDGFGSRAIFFTPDSQSLIYVAQRGNKWVVVENDKEGKAYDGINGADCVSMGQSNTHLAYVANQGGQWLVVVDGKENAKYPMVGCLRYSPDSQHLAFVATQGGQEFAVADGNPQPSYHGIVGDTFGYSPDSKHLAYAVTEVQGQAKQWFVTEDGKPLNSQPYDNVGRNSVHFSPDNQHVIYSEQTGSKWSVGFDGQVGGQYDSIADNTPIFSPDGKRLAYVAQKGGQWVAVLDGIESTPYDAIFTQYGSTLVFDSNTAIHYIALRGILLVMVEQRIL